MRPKATLRAVGLAAMLLGFALVARRPASALVERMYSLQEILDASKVIVEGKIEAVDQKNKTVTAAVTSTIKGICKIKRITINVGGAQEWYGVAFMKQAKEGEPIVFFWDVEGNRLPCEAYYKNFFFQIYGDYNPKEPDKSGWSFTHIETRMNRSYMGDAAELGPLVKDILAGKVKAPAPNPKAPTYSKAEMMGLLATRGIEVSDDPDGWEAHPQWIVEDWGNKLKAETIHWRSPTAPQVPEIQPGALGEYWQMTQPMADFIDPAPNKPTVRRVDKNIHVPDGTSVPETQLTENIFGRWTGLLRIPKDGKYKFSITSDDGSRLFINGQPLIDNGGSHAPTEKEAEITLKAGDHPFKLEWFQGTGGLSCKFQWSGEGIPKQFVPETVMFHNPPAEGRGKILKVDFGEGSKDKAAVSRMLEQDLSKATRILFEAENQTNKPIKLAWGISTNPNFSYYESPIVEVPPGRWHYDLQMPLTGAVFKSATTNWEYKSKLGNPSQMTKLTAVVYDPPKTGTLLIDRIRPDRGSTFIRSIPLERAPADARSIAVNDFDADGLPDILVCAETGNKLYRQAQPGEFVDVTAAAGLTGASRSGAWADYDGDGAADLVLSTPLLFKNEKGKLVAQPNALPQIPAANSDSIAWMDANGDGKPDLLIGRRESGMVLLLNQGNGTFKDASAELGLGKNPPFAEKGNLSFAADFDCDGWLDFLSTNGKGVLARNVEGKFKHNPVAKLEFVTDAKPGAAFADYDNDGDFDFFVPQNDKGQLWRNNNDYSFSNVIDGAGALGQLGGQIRSGTFGDINNDGFVDMVVSFGDAPAIVLLNDGRNKFTAAPFALSGFECSFGTTGMALADLDNDGDLDLVMCGGKGPAVLINGMPRPPLAQGGTLSLKVVLPASQPGALIRLADSSDKYAGLRQPGLPSNFNAQEPLVAHFGVLPGNYKLSVLLTHGEVRLHDVTVSDKPQTIVIK